MANRFWVGGSNTWNASFTGGRWASTSGGADNVSVPTSVDDVFLDGNSGSGTISVLVGAACKTLTCTGFTGTLALADQRLLVAGSVTLVSGMTVTYTAGSSSGGIEFAASGTLTTAGKDVGHVQANAASADMTITAADDVTLGGIGLMLGLSAHVETFNANNHNVTAASVLAVSNSPVLVMGSGTWTITKDDLYGGVSVFYFTAGTLTSNTSTLKLTSASANRASVRKAATGNLNIVWFAGANTGAGGTFGFFDSAVTVGTLKVSPDATLAWRATGQTITAATIDFNGTSGHLVTLNCLTPGVQGTLSVASGTVTADYCSITDNIAQGGATFRATHTTDGGGNTGWSFGSAANMFLVG